MQEVRAGFVFFFKFTILLRLHLEDLERFVRLDVFIFVKGGRQTVFLYSLCLAVGERDRPAGLVFLRADAFAVLCHADIDIRVDVPAVTLVVNATTIAFVQCLTYIICDFPHK